MVGSMRDRGVGGNKSKMIEVRFHSRGGQGGVTAAKLLGIAAFIEGKYSSVFSFYGAERRGTPTVSYTRISDEEIKVYSPIIYPDCVIIMDPSLINEGIDRDDKIESIVSCTIHPEDGLKSGGKVVINSENSIEGGFEGCEVYVVDATKISLDLGLKVAGAPVLNAPMLGAIARTGIVGLEAVKEAIISLFPDERNVKAAEMAYRGVRKVE
ncbi:MAG: 2-oxoacid:acceptor oxidoreductase family protein [Candidatus Methanospirareceae archaeon]